MDYAIKILRKQLEHQLFDEQYESIEKAITALEYINKDSHNELKDF
jgi:hypothetical protein